MSQPGTNKRRPLGRRGATAVEFAITANVLFLLLLGGLEIGRYFFVNESLRHLVGELARAAIVNPDADWSTQKNALVARSGILKVANFSRLDVTVARAAAPALTSVTVTANYNHSFLLPVLSGLANSINTAVRLDFVAP
ncbi:MAG: pilus assembly protein [Acetobacteraceae bacterium]|nr:pilus assembly protein [Acetobacteraceae bacterium]